MNVIEKIDLLLEKIALRAAPNRLVGYSWAFKRKIEREIKLDKRELDVKEIVEELVAHLKKNGMKQTRIQSGKFNGHKHWWAVVDDKWIVDIVPDEGTLNITKIDDKDYN